MIRKDDVVVKTADVDNATEGDMVSYTITVAPNATPTDLAYTISDTLPEGMTLVPDSIVASEGNVVANGNVLQWSFVQVPGGFDYVASNSQDDASCAVPSANHGAYTDLEAFGFVPKDLDGEGPFQQVLAGDGVPYYGGAPRPVLYYTANGMMSFDLDSILVDGNGAHQPIPLDTLPNALLAPLWTDMVLDKAKGGAISGAEYVIGDVGVSTLIEFDNLLLASDPSDASTIDMEVFVDARIRADAPEIIFAYANPTGQFATLLDGTIGLENDDGSRGVQIAHDDDGLQVGDGMAICFDLVPAGEPVTLTYQATVDAFDGPAKMLVNTALHDDDAPGTKPEATSWSVLASAADSASADLGVLVSGSPNPVMAGAQIEYVIDVSNQGPDAADAVALAVTLPAGLVYADAVGNGWSCAPGAVVSCTLDASLADAASAQLVLTVDVAPGAQGQRTTIVEVSAATDDPQAADNSTSDTTTVLPSGGAIFGDGFED